MSNKTNAINTVKKKQNTTNNTKQQISKTINDQSKSCSAMNKDGCNLDTAKLSDLAAVAMEKTAPLLSGIKDVASSAWDKITGGLTAADSDSIMPEWMSKLGSSISNTASEFADTIADKASGAANYLSGWLDKDGAELISSAGSALSWATNKVNQVSSLAQDATNWFNGITNSLSGKDSKNKKKKSAVKSGFVASNNKQGIENGKLAVADEGINFSKLKDKAFSKFAELAGPVTNLKDAISNVKKTVTCTVQSAFKTGATVVKTIQNTVNSVVTPINNVVKTVRKYTNPNNVQAMVTGALDFLPDSVSNMIGKAAYNQAAKVNNKLAHVQSKLGGIEGLGDKIIGLMSYSEGSPELLNDAGKIILGLATGDISKKDLDQLYKAATGYCNNVAAPSYMEFGNNKLVYETLLKQAISAGSSHLVAQLANCGKYFSSESAANIASEFLNVAKTGDPVMANTMLNATNTSMVENNKNLARTLGTNLKTEYSNCTGVVLRDLLDGNMALGIDDEGTSNLTPEYDDEGQLVQVHVADINKYYREEYLRFVSKLGLTPKQLLSDDNLEGSYSAEYVTLYARQPELLRDMGMSDIKRNTVLQVYTKYTVA